MRWFLILFLLVGSAQSKKCGGTFTAKRGILQTPNFPGKFQTPIECEWIIKSDLEGASIAVHATQLYIYEGLTFTEHVDSDRRMMPGRVIEIPKGERIFEMNFVKTHYSVLVINLKLNSLDNNNVRVLYGFMDVYGFNITYEITETPREDSCTVSSCMFNGICYDYVTHFGCECFPGYSGPNCLEGPNSHCYKNNRSLCQNGATCRHIGDKGVMCVCPSGYSGQFCEVSEKPKDCDGCLCIEAGAENNECQCSAENNLKQFGNDLQVFTISPRFINMPSSAEGVLKSLIKKQISHELGDLQVRNIHITSYESLESEVDISFRFYGPKSEENSLNKLRAKWIKDGSIGNMSVANTEIGFYHQPIILSILSIRNNMQGEIHERKQFVISCAIQASPNKSIRWYKDGILVNVSRSVSNKWTSLKKLDSSSQTYLAMLITEKATIADSGRYTCQVEDYGVTQCLSTMVYITVRPEVTLEPLSLTVSKGETFTVECSSDTKGQASYSWAKNGELLPTKTKREHYETLYMTGSILKVNGLNKSANYSCLVQRGTVRNERSIYVVVIDSKTVNPCNTENSTGVIWSRTAPGCESIQQCPMGYLGTARRACVMRDTHFPEWDEPDMSACISTLMRNIIRDFEYLQLGYETTTPAKTLSRSLNYLGSGIRLLNGEGSVIVSVIANIATYVKLLNYSNDMQDICRMVGAIATRILKQNNSLISDKQITEFQRSMKDIMVTCKLFLPVAQAFTYETDLVTTHLQPINQLTNFSSYLSSGTVNSVFRLTHVEENKQYFASIASIIYRNLHTFLPEKSALRINGSEFSYVIFSSIATAWYIGDTKTTTETFQLILHFSIMKAVNRERWNMTCVRAEYAPYENYWDKSACSTELLNSTYVRCNCVNFGTFAVIGVEVPQSGGLSGKSTPSKFIILAGCCLCLLLSVFTSILLLFHWLFHRSCISFLKLQCSASVIGAMGIFILSQTNSLNKDAYLYTHAFLQVFFLTALSTQLCVLLIIYADLLQFKGDNNLKSTTICVVTGPPLIIVFGNYLSHLSMHLELYSWWIIIGSTSFYVFVICCCILIFSFNIMYFVISKYIKGNENINISKKRVILFHRSMYIFYAVSAVVASSILYVNMIDNIICHLIFSIASVTLGVVLLLCYVLKSDDIMEQYFLKRINADQNDTIKKNNTISLGNTPPNNSEKQDVLQVGSIAEQTPNNSKHVVISLDNHRNVKSSIKTPDILNGDSYANLDLINTSQIKDKHCQTNSEDRTRSGAKTKPNKRICKCCIKDRKVSTQKKPNPHLSKPVSENSASKSKKLEKETVPQKKSFRSSKEDLNSEVEVSCDNSVRTEPEVLPVGEPKTNENLDAVMSSISEDLDYLLNRSSEIK